MNEDLRTVWTIADREIRTRVRSMAFRISAAAILLAVVLLIVIPTRIGQHQQTYTVAVVATQSQSLSNAVVAQGAASGLDVRPRIVGDRSAAVGLVESGAADVAVVATTSTVELLWDEGTDPTLTPPLESAVNRFAVEQRAAALGLTPAQVTGLLAPARPAVTVLNPSADHAGRLVVAFVGVILLFIALNLYGGYVLTGVVEEKSSRVVEVLLARVRPTQLLAGKILGIGLLGAAQLAAVAVVAAITLQIVNPPDLPAGTLPQIASVVLWFVLGYSFYSVLYGALGSLASRTQDAQAAAAPLTTVLTLAYLGVFIAEANPTAWWVTVLSFLPPTAPIYLPLRSALTDVPLWQALLAALLLVAGTGVLLRVGGRLYQGAVLQVGPRLKLRQAWRSGPSPGTRGE